MQQIREGKVCGGWRQTYARPVHTHTHAYTHTHARPEQRRGRGSRLQRGGGGGGGGGGGWGGRPGIAAVRRGVPIMLRRLLTTTLRSLFLAFATAAATAFVIFIFLVGFAISFSLLVLLR